MTALPTLSGGFEEASTADKGHDRAARVRDSMSLNGQKRTNRLDSGIGAKRTRKWE